MKPLQLGFDIDAGQVKPAANRAAGLSSGIDASGTVLSPCERYRFVLSRAGLLEGGARGLGRVLFLAANPSKASAEVEDNTSIRWLGFTRRWGYGNYRAGNVCAWRETKPRLLMLEAAKGTDVIGRSSDPRYDNDTVLLREAREADLVVVCWGDALKFGPRAPEQLRGRDKAVLALLSDIELWCFGRNDSGSPKHPLRLDDNTPLVRFIA